MILDNMPFNGFSIVLNKPSRHDKKNGKLLSSKSGEWFEKQLSKNGVLLSDCHVTTADCNNIPPDTKTLFLLGDDALKIFKDNVSLGEQRGAPFIIALPTGNINVIASFTPQDAFDIQNYEARFNSGNIDEREGSKADTGKAHGKTSRANFKFWFEKDIQKITRIHREGKINIIEPDLYIYPSQEEVINELLKHKGKDFTFDIETNPETCDITVFSFCFTDPNDNISIPFVWVVPVWRYNYTLAYENIYKIFAALAIAMRDNVCIHHNGSGYDLFILAYKYKIPFGINNFDTMLSFSRCYPEIEKSLGHVLSLLTDFPYHKNTAGTYIPFNPTQEFQLWTYNGTDTHTTLYAKRGIIEYSKSIGATESIQQINRSIYPYLLMTFMGMRIDKVGIDKVIIDNDARINQLLRILTLLVGRPLNPASYKDMPHYLYSKKSLGGLGLPVPHTTKDGNPACDAPAIIKLILKFPEIVSLRVVLEIRRVQAESKALMFKPISW